MYAQPNSSGSFTDHGTVFQSVIDTLDGVIFHTDQEA